MKKALVLGAGRVGSVIALDLSIDTEVIVVDNSTEALDNVHGENITRVHRSDCVRKETIRELLDLYTPDIVIGALPSTLGYNALRQVIGAGYDYVDISFMTEDPRKLDQWARENGVTAVVDMGIRPGLGNVLAGHAYSMLNRCTHLRICVGGVPLRPQPPFNYKAGFAPADVIEEYVRPARMKIDGEIVIKPALTDIKPIEFDGIGHLEEFNTDGLRTLLDLDIPNMVEKTIRWPGHAALMRVFRDAGFFSKERCMVNDEHVTPLDVTSNILFPLWKMEEGDEDITLMKVMATGDEATDPMFIWNVIVGYGYGMDCTSMSRATALPCTTVARLILEGAIPQKGIIVPETLGQDDTLYAEIMLRLHQKGIILEAKTALSV